MHVVGGVNSELGNPRAGVECHIIECGGAPIDRCFSVKSCRKRVVFSTWEGNWLKYDVIEWAWRVGCIASE